MYRNRDIIARKIHDTYFLINSRENYLHDKCTLYEINEIGFFIWERIGEGTPRETVVRELQKAVNETVAYEVLYQDVTDFLYELEKLGFVSSV